MNYREIYRQWIEDPYYDEETKEELLAIKDEKEIEDRFYKDLEFGTGGMRGIIGAGTNRLNKYTVRKAAQGLANFIKSRAREIRESLLHMTAAAVLMSLPWRPLWSWQPII